MSESILIGTRGWDYDEWNGGFYPEDLPEDWRFAYYSNHLRSVLVPQEVWATRGLEDVRDWIEDCDPEFRFILESPVELLRSATNEPNGLDAFLKLIAPLAAHTTGVLMRVSGEISGTVHRFEQVLANLASIHPLCVDLPSSWRSPAMFANLERHGAGLCWHPDTAEAPRTGGRLLVALTREAAPRAQRRIIEQLIAWKGDRGLAGLFFEAGMVAAEQAKQARLIAELMDA